MYGWGFGVLWWGVHVVCGLCLSLDRPWGVGMWAQAVLSRFSGFSAVASFSKLQLRTYEVYGVEVKNRYGGQ